MKKASENPFVKTSKFFVRLILFGILGILGILLVLYITTFVLSLLNLRHNRCTHVPILSNLNLIKSCSAIETCKRDDECKWELEVNEAKECKVYAVNLVEARCNEDTERFKKELGTEMARRSGWKTEKDVCRDLMLAFSSYQGEEWHQAVYLCPSQIPDGVYCKKTKWDEYVDGYGVCALGNKNQEKI